MPPSCAERNWTWSSSEEVPRSVDGSSHQKRMSVLIISSTATKSLWAPNCPQANLLIIWFLCVQPSKNRRYLSLALWRTSVDRTPVSSSEANQRLFTPSEILLLSLLRKWRLVTVVAASKGSFEIIRTGWMLDEHMWYIQDSTPKGHQMTAKSAQSWTDLDTYFRRSFGRLVLGECAIQWHRFQRPNNDWRLLDKLFATFANLDFCLY